MQAQQQNILVSEGYQQIQQNFIQNVHDTNNQGLQTAMQALDPEQQKNQQGKTKIRLISQQLIILPIPIELQVLAQKPPIEQQVIVRTDLIKQQVNISTPIEQQLLTQKNGTHQNIILQIQSIVQQIVIKTQLIIKTSAIQQIQQKDILQIRSITQQMISQQQTQQKDNQLKKSQPHDEYQNAIHQLQSISSKLKLIKKEKLTEKYKKLLNVLLFFMANQINIQNQRINLIQYEEISIADIFQYRPLNNKKIQSQQQQPNQLFQLSSQIQTVLKQNMIIHARITFLIYSITISYNYKRSDIKQLISSNNVALNGDQDFIQKIRRQIQRQRLQYSFDHHIWVMKSFKRLNSFDYLKDQRKQVFDWKQHKNTQLNIINYFLFEIGYTLSSHKFHSKFINLTSSQHKHRYSRQLALYPFIQTKTIPTQIMNVQDCLKNLLFYLNKKSLTYGNLTIQKIHSNKKTDYQWLQDRHDYIQWLFPNHFQSNFNQNSYALSYVQAQIFKRDFNIGHKLYKSLQIYLGFMGCEILIIKNQFKIQQLKQKNAKKRTQNVLIRYCHNHLRIMRILACLSITGFRQIAQQLLDFLNKLQTTQLLYNRSEVFKRALKSKWNLYQSDTKEKKEKALKMCFLPYERFPSRHPYLINMLINSECSSSIDSAQF